MAKYIGGINIENEADVEKVKKLELCQDVPDEVLEASPGTWLTFEIEYLELFWMSNTRKEIIDAGLALVIKKNANEW